MNGQPPPASWTAKAWSAVFALLAIAVGARLVWMLLAPLLPFLVGVGVVLLAAQYWRRNFW